MASDEMDRTPVRFVHELFEAQVKRTPHILAVMTDDQQVTYQELNRRANRLARYLGTLGVGPESRIGICMERGPELFIAILAVFKAGGAYVPLDPAYPSDRLTYMIEDARIGVMLTQQHLSSGLAPYEMKIVCVDWDEDQFMRYRDDDFSNGAIPENLAYIIYTSGSTGGPKGVMIEHKALAIYTETTNHIFKMEPGERKLQFASISFDVSVAEIFCGLTQGATIVLRTDDLLDYSAFIQKCRDLSLALISLPTAYWHELTHQLISGDMTFPPSVRMVTIGTEKALLESLAIWKKHMDPRIRLLNAYGPTETTITSTVCDIAGPFAIDIDEGCEIPIGKPIPGAQTYVLDEDCNPVPRGEAGELYIGGFGLARGYLNHPELTAASFIPNPFSEIPGERLYKTGDRVRCLADENLEFLGRMDHQIKLRGFRIEPGEIEAAIRQNARVKECMVIAREDTPGDKRLVAYIIPHHETPHVAELREQLKQNLANYMIPSAYVMLDEWPLTSNEKINREMLPPPARSDLAISRQVVQARDSLESKLTIIWEQTLHFSPIGIRDNFFDLGGHSLLAVELFNKIEQATGKALPQSILFQAPTIEKLVVLLRNQKTNTSETSALVPIQPNGVKPPFFCVHGHLGNVLTFADLSKHLGDDQPFYGLQSIGLVGNQAPITHIEAMAKRYLEEIRTVQPAGPYYIGGYCFGSLVALEMAHQLLAQGEETARLVFFDVMPDMFPLQVSTDVIQRYKMYETRHRIQRHVKQMKGKNITQCTAYLTAGFIRKTRNLMNRLDWRFMERQGPVTDVGDTNLYALKMYEIRPYIGDLILFQSKEIMQATCSENPTADWSGLARGKTTLCLVKDGGVPDMGYMFKEPCVEDLAMQLAHVLYEGSEGVLPTAFPDEILATQP